MSLSSNSTMSSIDLLDIPMGAFWDCIDNDAPNHYEYCSLIFNHLKNIE